MSLSLFSLSLSLFVGEKKAPQKSLGVFKGMSSGFTVNPPVPHTCQSRQERGDTRGTDIVCLN